MTTSSLPWDGNLLVHGPIAVALQHLASEGGPSVTGILVAYPPGGVPVEVPVQRLGEFFELHNSRLFISVDVVPIHKRLLEEFKGVQGGESIRKAAWALTREGRWVDLRLLDRQVRCARKSNDFAVREWNRIVEDHLPAPTSVNQVAAEFPGIVLSVFERLNEAATQLAEEGAPIGRPEFDFGKPTPEIEGLGSQRANAQRVLGRTPTGNPPSEQQVKRPLDTEKPRKPTTESAPLVHRIEVQGAVIFDHLGTTELSLDSCRVRDFLERVEKEYRWASQMLKKPATVEGCFEWDTEAVALRRGYPVSRDKKLAAWLTDEFGHLTDAQNEQPDIPRNENGRPTLNPEYWSFWPGCNDRLWAWRQVYRLAELSRMVRSDLIVRPAYEMVPRLRSKEPNLTVYRSLGYPVFRARDGHVLVAGEVPNLRIHCLSAICAGRGYTHRGRWRLRHYLLRENDPLTTAARELYERYGERFRTANRLHCKSQEAASQAGWSLPDSCTEDDAAESACGEEVVAWERIESNEWKFSFWLALTHALLVTAPLGLQVNSHNALLRNDFRITLDALDLTRLREILVEYVVPELQLFLQDATSDLVAMRAGLSSNEAVMKFANFQNPDATGATLRKNIRQRRRRTPSGVLAKSGSDHLDHHGQGATRGDIFKYRALTLGGRVTYKSTSAAVRRQELLMAEEEVMVAIAHELCASGYRLVGLAGSEFVLEMPADKVTPMELQNIANLSQKASGRLVDFSLPIIASVVKYW